MPRPGDSLGALDVEALEVTAQTEDAQDIDIDAWLTDQAAAAKETGEVVIDGKRIKIAVVSEGEENRLIKRARRPNSKDPRDTKVDMLLYRREYVAFSLSKAYGRPVLAEALESMPPGNLTKLQNEIQRLSKYEHPEHQLDPFSFLG